MRMAWGRVAALFVVNGRDHPEHAVISVGKYSGSLVRMSCAKRFVFGVTRNAGFGLLIDPVSYVRGIVRKPYDAFVIVHADFRNPLLGAYVANYASRGFAVIPKHAVVGRVDYRFRYTMRGPHGLFEVKPFLHVENEIKEAHVGHQQDQPYAQGDPKSYGSENVGQYVFETVHFRPRLHLPVRFLGAVTWSPILTPAEAGGRLNTGAFGRLWIEVSAGITELGRFVIECVTVCST
jgi:hypothetical protein